MSAGVFFMLKGKHVGMLKKTLFWSYISNFVGLMPGRITLTLSLMVFISLTEGISLLLLVPLLQLVGLNVDGGSLGQIAGFVSSIFNYLHIKPTLIVVIVIYIVIISLNAFLTRLQSVTASKIEYDFAAHLRKRLFQAITHSKLLYFSRKRSADLAHALTYEIERISSGTYFFLSMISSGMVLIVYIIFALNLSGIVTGFIFIIGVALLLALRRRMISSGVIGQEITESSKNLYSSTLQHLDGMKTIKSYNLEERNIRDFTNYTDKVVDKYKDSVRSYADVKFLFDVGSVVVLGFLVIILINFLSLSTAALLLLLFLFVRMIPNFSLIQHSYQYFINMLPGFSNVTTLETEFENEAEPLVSEGEKIDLTREISLEEVSFNYNPSNINDVEFSQSLTIQSLNLIIKAGKTTALAGPSGAGKSTIADLLMGLITPDEGYLKVDDEKLAMNNLSTWRSKIGYVAQETFLFNDSVRSNILLDSQGSDDDLMEALKSSAASEFISKLPMGLDTIIGDRGVRLSGGERQRIALARALLRHPSLLILDEATSNLDSVNEKRILDAIEELHGEMTILIIAHRLSTISKADYIYLIEDGIVKESGTWNSLLKKEDGIFKELYNAQS